MRRSSNITTTSCGRGEFSYASVCYQFVANKFNGVFKRQRMWEDSRALVSALDAAGVADGLAKVMKQEVVFSDPRLCHEIQANRANHVQ